MERPFSDRRLISDPRIAAAVRDQHGMLARRQLTAAGVDWGEVQAQVDAQRWAERTPRVLSTFTGELTVAQRRWLAVLHAGQRSMLGGLTAAARHGLRGWERDHVTVLVDDELSFEPVPGVRFFRSRRPFELLRTTRSGIPSAQLEAALLLWAAYDSSEPRPAVGVLAAAVQQRLTTARRLQGWIDQLRPLRRATLFRSALADIDQGAHSASELEITRLCRTFGFPRPARQVARRDSRGNQRWTDCEWRLRDGTVLVLEVDGSHHLDVQSWTADIRRTRRISGQGRIVVRCTAYELRHEAHVVAEDLMNLGLIGRVPETGSGPGLRHTTG